MAKSKPNYIEVVKGQYEGARGYILSEGTNPNLYNCCIYKDGKEITIKIKYDEIEIIEPLKECAQ